MATYRNFLLTLLIFLVMQALGGIVLWGICAFCHLPAEQSTAPLLAAILIAANLLTVLLCHLALHNVRLKATFSVASIHWRHTHTAILAALAAILCTSILTDSIESPVYLQQTITALAGSVWGVFALTVAGPVTEELIFREALMGDLLRRGINPWIAVMTSAIAFSTMHFNWAQSLYALPTAILFGIIYLRTGNIVLTSLLHVFNNALSVFLMQRYGPDASVTHWFGSPATATIVMATSGILSIALCIAFWNTYPAKHRQQPAQGDKHCAR